MVGLGCVCVLLVVFVCYVFDCSSEIDGECCYVEQFVVCLLYGQFGVQCLQCWGIVVELDCCGDEGMVIGSIYLGEFQMVIEVVGYVCGKCGVWVGQYGVVGLQCVGGGGVGVVGVCIKEQISVLVLGQVFGVGQVWYEYQVCWFQVCLVGCCMELCIGVVWVG